MHPLSLFTLSDIYDTITLIYHSYLIGIISAAVVMKEGYVYGL